MALTLTTPLAEAATAATENPLAAPIAGPDYAEPVRDIALPASTAAPEFYTDTLDQDETDYQAELDAWRRDSIAGLDARLLDPKAYTDERIPGGWTPDDWRKTRAVDDFFRIALETDEPPMDGRREFLRAKLAEERFGGKGANSDAELYAELTREAQGRQETATRYATVARHAEQAAILAIEKPGEVATGWKTLREQLKTMPGYRPEDEPDLLAAYQQSVTAYREAIAPYAAELREMVSTFKKQDGAGPITAVLKEGTAMGVASAMFGDKSQTSRSAWDIWQSLDPAERPGFEKAIGMLARTLPEKDRPTFWNNLFKSSGRMLESNLGDAWNTMRSINAPAEFDALAKATGNPDMGFPQQANSAQEMRERMNFQSRMVALQQQEVDPIKEVSAGPVGKFFERLAYNTPGMVLTSMEAVYAPALLAASTKENHYQSMLQRRLEAGDSYADASAFAEQASPVGAALEFIGERVGAKLLGGELPWFNKALTRVMDKISNPLGRAATRFAAGGTQEGLTEVGQNYIDAVVQDLGHALGMDVGPTKWLGENGEFKGDWKDNLDTFALGFPLAIFGIRGSFGRDARVKAFAEASDLQMRAIGYKPDSIRNIRNGIAQGLSSGEQAIDAEYDNVDPQSPEAKAAAEEQALKAKLQAAAAEAMRASGDVPIFEHSGDVPIFEHSKEGFRVIDPKTGDELGTATDYAGAMKIADAHSQYIHDMDQDALEFMATWLEGTDEALKLDPEAVNRIEMGKHWLEWITEAGNEKHLARLLAQAKDQELAATGEDFFNAEINGFSHTEFANGVRTTINRALKGGNLITTVHEIGHGARRKAYAKGKMTRDEEIRMYRSIDAVVAEAGGNKGPKRKAGTDAEGKPIMVRMSLIPEEFTDDATIPDRILDEAFSEMLEMELLRTRAGGKKRTAPGRLSVLNMPGGILTRHLNALVRLAGPEVVGKFRAFMDALRIHMKAALPRMILLKKAEREGKFDADTYDAFLAKMLGLDVQDDFEQQVDAEGQRITGDPRLTPEAFAAALNPDLDPAEDEIPFSLGRVTLPATTQESRTISDAAPVADLTADSGTSPVSNALAFQSAPSEPGDTGNVAFSLSRARENYETAKTRVLEARKELSDAEAQTQAARAKWEEVHGITKIQHGGRGIITTANSQRPAVSQYGNATDRKVKISQSGLGLIVKADRIVWEGDEIWAADGYDFAEFPNDENLQKSRDALAQAEADLYLAEQEFDPANAPDEDDNSPDPLPSAAAVIRQRELSKQAAMFAALLDARDEEAKNAARSFIARVWNAYAKHDELFQYGRSTSKDAAEIAKAVSSPGKLITVVDNGDSIRVQSKNGYLTILEADTARPVINSPQADSRGKKEGGGSQLYAVAFDWIHNNNKRVKDDSGLTGINWVRRTSNMAASALRWGTTRHLKPHKDQAVGKWTTNDLFNTSLLLTKEMDNAHRILPQSKALRYDFASDTFTRDGNAVTTEELATLIEDTKSFDKGIGVSTLQRAVITASAIEEFQRGTAESIIQQAESDLPASLTGVSYSLAPSRGDRPLFSSARVHDLRHDKTAWTTAGAAPDGAREIVAKYYKTDAYYGIPKDATLVPMPSTSGKNILPAALAERIAKDFGQPVEKRVVANAIAKGEAKDKRTFFDKEADPVGYVPVPEVIADLRGKAVFITEDVHNTGESWIAFARMLIEQGVDVRGVATLVSTEQRMTSPRDIERMAEKITAHTGIAVDDVLPVMHSLFDGSFKQLANKAEADITRSAEKARKLYDIAASGRRAGTYSNPLRSGDQGAGGILGNQQVTQGTFGFSLAPSRALDLMRMNALDRVRNPAQRAKIFQRMSREFEALKLAAERFELIAGDKRLKKSLAREAAMREAIRREELEAEAYARHYHIFADDELVKLKSQRAHHELAIHRAAHTQTRKRNDGSTYTVAIPAGPDPFRGRIMSKAAWLKQYANSLWDTNKAGDYDGSEGLSPTNFGGTLTPSQAVEALVDAEILPPGSKPDDMWALLASEESFVTGMQEAKAKALADIAAARAQAKQETNDWLREQGTNQAANHSPRQEILRALASLEAILRALPPAVRAKVGGHIEISRIASEELRLKFLKDKIAKADVELDKWMRETLDKEFRDLLDKTRPERDEAGKRPKGKIGADVHDLFRDLQEVIYLDGAETEAEATRLETLADAETTTAEQAAHLTMQANLVRLCGDWAHASAERMEMALAEATRIYQGGYAEAMFKNAQRRARINGRRASLKADTGKAGERMERVEREIKDRGTILGRLREVLFSMFSFDQVLNLVFSEGSDTARMFAEWELRAANDKEDAIQRAHNAVESLLTSLGGNPLAGEKLRWKLATEQAVKWTDWKGIEQTATEMEAVSYTLMWAQADGKRHMEGQIREDEDGNEIIVSQWHWRQEDIDALEAQLSPEAKAIRLHLRESYGSEYDRINSVFSDLYGVNMPRHKDYAPIAVSPAHSPGGQVADPVSGTMQGPGLTPGSLKNRSHSAVAEPQKIDALQHYVAHVKQMEHFIAYAQLSSELMAVLNNRELGNSIEAKAGKEALKTLRAWADHFAQGGTRDAAAHLAVNGWFRRGLDRISQMALIGRISVLAVQSVQLGAAAYQMPVGSYLKRLAKLTTGQLSWGKAIRSPYIQRRLAQMPPAVQHAMEGLAAGRPSRIKHETARLGRLISGADAFFTAGTYAIIYDYHLKLAKERGIPNAEEFAEAEAIRLTDQVAQPMRAGARSLIENTATNPAFRMMWAFSSEPRQKIALSAYGLMQKDGPERFRAAAITWTVSGLLAAVVRSAIRDLRDDGDDDEVFDGKNWDPTRLALMAAAGPIGGLPIVGKEIEASIYAGAGEFIPSGSLLSGPQKAVGVIRKHATGKGEWEDAIKDAETLLMGAGVASPTTAAAASWSHIARDLEAIIRNLTEE